MLKRPNTRIATLFCFFAIISVPCLQAEAKSKMQKQLFGKTEDGQQADLYTLTNKNGVEAQITN
jgi:hypothetical protein